MKQNFKSRSKRKNVLTRRYVRQNTNNARHDDSKSVTRPSDADKIRFLFVVVYVVRSRSFHLHKDCVTVQSALFQFSIGIKFLSLVRREPYVSLCDKPKRNRSVFFDHRQRDKLSCKQDHRRVCKL